MIPCILLARVSSEGQTDGFSLDAQENIGIDYCKNKELRIEKTFKISESAWGKKERKDFNTALSYAEENDIKHIVIEKIDRSLRNLTDFVRLSDMAEGGFTIHWIKEGILDKNTSSSEKFFYAIMAASAKNMSDRISEDIKKGTLQKLKNGIPLRRLYGYRQQERQIYIIEKEAEVVRRIYREYLGGLNIIEIADLLNAEGIPAPRGPRWNNQTIHRILTRPDYIGEMVFRGQQYKGNYDLIISPDDYYTVQKRISSGNRKSDLSRWPLSGLVRWESGRLLSGQTVKGHYYYGAPVDEKKKIRRYLRQDHLLEQIDKTIESTKWPDRFARHVLDFAKSCYASETKARQSARKQAYDKLNKLKAKNERLTGLYLEGEIERFDYLRRKHDIEAEIDKAENVANAETIDHKEFLLQVDRVAYVFHELPDIYRTGSLADKVNILRSYVKNVIVSPDKRLIRLEYRQPFAEFLTPEILSISGSTSPANMEIRGRNSNQYKQAQRSVERVLTDLFYRAA